MLNQILRTKKLKKADGFSLAEIVVATAIVGTLGGIGYPNYIKSNDSSKRSIVQATMATIPPIIAAFIDETGEQPATWDDLTSISAIMTAEGAASGNLSEPIKMKNSEYKITITGPISSIYSLSANRNQSEGKDKVTLKSDTLDIKSCFNISNGASDLTKGNGEDEAEAPNCG